MQNINQVKNTIYNLVKDNCPIDYNPTDFVLDIIKPLAKDKLNQCIKECHECDICKNNIKTFFNGTGNEPILIIGETALSSQNQDCYPFEKSEEGILLSNILNDLCINFNQISWINSINCFCSRTDSQNNITKRPPTEQEAQSCSLFLNYAINSFRPKMIILLGNIALNMFKYERLQKILNKQIDIKGIPSFAVYSPTYALEMDKLNHDSSFVKDLYEGLQHSFNWFNKQYPEYQIFNKK